MKALPIVLFVVAVIFAVIEWEHGRVHEAVLENASLRIKNLQIPERPTPQMELRRVQHGPLGVGKVVPRGEQPPVAPQSPATTPTEQIATVKAQQAQEDAAFKHSENNMMTVRLILTAIFIPACFLIILAKSRFDGKDRGFAYTTLGAILTFWLHN
jgi:hypothetical protein